MSIKKMGGFFPSDEKYFENKHAENKLLQHWPDAHLGIYFSSRKTKATNENERGEHGVTME